MSDNLMIFPYFRDPESGNWTLSDDQMAYIWMCLEQEGKVKWLFYDGSIRDLTGWLAFVKRADIYLAVVVDTSKYVPVHVAWLKDVQDAVAWVHHTSVGRYRHGAWRCVLEYWKKFDFIKVLLGLTPKTNERAWKFTEKICKWTLVGEIPDICNMAYEGTRAPGIISYYHLHPDTAQAQGVEQWVENQGARAAAV